MCFDLLLNRGCASKPKHWTQVLPSFELPLRHSFLVFTFAIGLFLSSASAQEQIPERQPLVHAGLVVESVVKNQEGEKAGIRRGDILLRWSRGRAEGNLGLPFDLLYLVNEQASRGPLAIAGIRGSAKRVWVLGAETWGIRTRPRLQGNLFELYEQGWQLVEAKELDEAVERWRTAAALARTSEPPWVAAWFLIYAAQTVGPQGRNYESLLDEAIQVTDAGPLVRAEIYIRLAYAFLTRNDLPGTEACFEKAAKEWQRQGSAPLAVATALDSAGWAAQQYGNLSKADEYYQEAARIAEHAAPTSRPALFGLMDVGEILESRGDASKAETYYLRALAIAEHRHVHDISLPRILSSLAILEHRRGNLSAAEVRYRQALAVVKRLNADGLELASSLSQLAECLIDKGDTRAAEAYETEALTLRQRLAPRSLAVGFSYRNLGKIARIRREWDKAESYYRQALEIGSSVAPASESTLRFLIGLGYVSRDRGQWEQAEGYFRQALAIAEHLRPTSLEHAELVADLANALYHHGELDEAGKLYREAIAELEDKSFSLGGGDDDRLRYRAGHVQVYKEYVGLLVDQGEPELAFEQLEASRARTLLELLVRSQIDIRYGVDGPLLTQERDLGQSITRKLQDRTRLNERNQEDQQMALVDEEIATLHEKYQQLQAEIRATSPGYAALTQPQRLKIREIQQLLDPDTVLLEYSLGEDHSYVWSVSAISLQIRQLPKRVELESAARRVYALLTTRNKSAPGETESQRRARWSRADKEYSTLSAQFSRMMLGPIAQALKDKRLVVVSDGALQYVPFAALPSPLNPSVPLVAEHEVVNLPSASVLAELRRAREARAPHSREVAVLADPVFSLSDERVVAGTEIHGQHSTPTESVSLMRGSKSSASPEKLTRSAADVGLATNRKIYLSRLLSTRREAESIMAVSPPGKRLKAVDFDATRAMAMNPTLAQYRIVHFATHGFLDSKHPELSGLVLSLVNRQGKSVDGFLNLQDIYNLNLPADLVVLSACETALGEDISGEGLIGLTRGFMYAGATRVVASLWNVSDEATSDLMALFYRSMEVQHMPPAAALRQAQIQMWKQSRWKPAYYWAAFQIQGEWE